MFSFAVLRSPVDERTSAVHEGNVWLDETLTFLNILGSTVVIFQQILCCFSSPSFAPICGACSPGLLAWLSFSWQQGVARLWNCHGFFVQEWQGRGLLKILHPLLRYESKAETQNKNRSYVCVRRAFPPPGKVAGERELKNRSKLSFKLY